MFEDEDDLPRRVLEFRDLDSGDDGLWTVRSTGRGIGLKLSLADESGVEVYMAVEDARRVADYLAGLGSAAGEVESEPGSFEFSEDEGSGSLSVREAEGGAGIGLDDLNSDLEAFVATDDLARLAALILEVATPRA